MSSGDPIYWSTKVQCNTLQSFVTVNPSIGPSSGGYLVTLRVHHKEFSSKIANEISCVLDGKDFPYAFCRGSLIYCMIPAINHGIISIGVRMNIGSRFQLNMLTNYQSFEDIRIDSIYPSFGPSSGSTVISLYGEYFTHDLAYSCKFGSNMGKSSLITSTLLLSEVPASATDGVVCVNLVFDGQIFAANSCVHKFVYIDCNSLEFDTKEGTKATIRGLELCVQETIFLLFGQTISQCTQDCTLKHVVCDIPFGLSDMKSPFVFKNIAQIIFLGNNLLRNDSILCLYDSFKFKTGRVLSSTVLSCPMPVLLNSNSSLELRRNDRNVGFIGNLSMIAAIEMKIEPSLGPTSGGTIVVFRMSRKLNFVRIEFGTVPAKLLRQDDFAAIFAAPLNRQGGVVDIHFFLSPEINFVVGKFEFMNPAVVSMIHPTIVSTSGSRIQILGTDFRPLSRYFLVSKNQELEISNIVYISSTQLSTTVGYGTDGKYLEFDFYEENDLILSKIVFHIARDYRIYEIIPSTAIEGRKFQMTITGVGFTEDITILHGNSKHWNNASVSIEIASFSFQSSNVLRLDSQAFANLSIYPKVWKGSNLPQITFHGSYFSPQIKYSCSMNTVWQEILFVDSAHLVCELNSSLTAGLYDISLWKGDHKLFSDSFYYIPAWHVLDSFPRIFNSRSISKLYIRVAYPIPNHIFRLVIANDFMSEVEIADANLLYGVIPPRGPGEVAIALCVSNQEHVTHTSCQNIWNSVIPVVDRLQLFAVEPSVVSQAGTSSTITVIGSQSLHGFNHSVIFNHSTLVEADKINETSLEAKLPVINQIGNFAISCFEKNARFQIMESPHSFKIRPSMGSLRGRSLVTHCLQH
eukprot:765135-Hanusia_phi.AAC.2